MDGEGVYKICLCYNLEVIKLIQCLFRVVGFYTIAREDLPKLEQSPLPLTWLRK
jgi:hypothetical protein